MCYQVVISTDSAADLSVYNGELLRFSTELPMEIDLDVLSYKNRWHAGSRTGCSCTFRHIMGPEAAFGLPEEWFPEDEDAVEATARFIAVVRALLAAGYQVDCLDVWVGDGPRPAALTRREVDLAALKKGEFRFFENCIFNFK